MSKHNAPSVIYPLGRSRVQGQILAGFWLVGLLVMGLWAATGQTFGWRQGLGFAIVALLAVVIRTGWRHSAAGQLAWDGQDWHWESRGYQAGAADHSVAVAFDFQSLMLLRIDNPDQARMWLWAERRAAPERWLDLRRALYSPRRQPDTSPGLA